MGEKKPTYHDLKILYDIINEIMGDKDVFYTQEELESLKKDKSNIFLSKEGEHEER